jgi:uncharacterized protein
MFKSEQTERFAGVEATIKGLICPAIGETRLEDHRSRITFLDKEDSHLTTKSEHSASGDKAGGQKGVIQEQVGSGKDKDPNNFADDPERAAEAGRKGGHESHKRD